MNSRRFWLAVLVATALMRVLTLAAYPLHDTTEARYAEIARVMVVSENWITPQIEPGVPFWAKPPLSIWATAASLKLFGFNEFAARIPALLFTLLTIAIVFGLGRRLYSADAGIVASAILLTSIVGFVASGAVMTDSALLLATTISLASFCLTIRGSRSLRGYGLFVGLGLGLLAKGPIALVLTGLPILAWSLWKRNLLWLWRALPWITGCLLMLAIAIPWYWMAEIKSPGFLEYFLVGEHWLRFVDSGWRGDMYGYAHSRPRGTIWLYGLAATVPWSVVALYALQKRRTGSNTGSITSMQAFLLLWAVAPLVFFTFAGNILPAYVLPGVPAFALLLGNWATGRSPSLAYAGLIVPGFIAVASISGLFASAAYRTQKELVAYHYETTPDATLYYYPRLPSSASFYSNGRAQALRTDAELERFLLEHKNGIVAIRSKDANKLETELASCLVVEAVVHNRVLFVPARDCPAARNPAKIASQ